MGAFTPPSQESQSTMLKSITTETSRLLVLEKSFQELLAFATHTVPPSSQRFDGQVMRITEIHLTLVDRPDDCLRAFCSVTFDNVFVVKDLRVIEGPRGLFVAIPSENRTATNPHLRATNPLQARCRSERGYRFALDEPKDFGGTPHSETMHPITAAFRARLESRVIAAYREQMRIIREAGEPNEPSLHVQTG